MFNLNYSFYSRDDITICVETLKPELSEFLFCQEFVEKLQFLVDKKCSPKQNVNFILNQVYFTGY